MAKKKVSKKTKKEETETVGKWASFLSDKLGVVTPKDNTDIYPYIIPFHHDGLNMATGGGIIGGTMCEVSGLSGTSKSYLAYEAGSEAISMGGYFTLIDTEQAFKHSYGKKVGLIADGKHFSISDENSMEKIFKIIKATIKLIREERKEHDIPILFCIDSYAGMRIELDLKNDAAMKDPIGFMAAQTNIKFNELISKLIPMLKRHKATLILVNQLTKKFKQTPSGMDTYYESLNEDKIAYFSTQRIRLSQGRIDGHKKIITRKMPSMSKYKETIKKQIGLWILAETLKNRLIEPFQKVEIRILYNSGLKRYSGLAEILMNRNYIRLATKANYNKDGKKLKTPLMGFKVNMSTDKDEFFEIGVKKENPKNKDIERAAKEVIEAYPKLLESEFYEFDRDKDEDSYDDENTTTMVMDKEDE